MAGKLYCNRGSVLQLRQLGWAGIVLQEGFVLQRRRLRDCIAGHQVYCNTGRAGWLGKGVCCNTHSVLWLGKEYRLLGKLYCNTVSCIVNRRLQGWWLEVYCNRKNCIAT